MPSIISHLIMRQAELKDLPFILELLADDPLGKKREIISEKVDKRYLAAFTRIMDDPNQFLMVVVHNAHIIGTCHLTLLPSLTYTGSTRMQIEAVRLYEKNGFTIYGTEPRSLKINENFYDEHLMILKLS